MLLPVHLFCPQPFPRNHIPRERLVRLFQQYDLARVILVQATAGYGKSVAVNEFVQQLSTLAAWYPLQLLDEKTPLSFVWNLLRAIQVAQPGFGETLELLLEESVNVQQQISSKQWLRQTILPALIHELGAIAAPFWIVLEDYHTLQDAEIDAAFIYLVEKSPSQVRFIATSRQNPNWSDQLYWQTQELLTVIPEDELAFTKNESQLLAHHIGVSLDQNQIETIYADIGGWPVLHYLLYTNYREGGEEQMAAILAFLTRPNQVVYNYLAEELLNRQPPIMRDFLCRTSILRQLNVETCNALLDTEDAAKLLSLLEGSLFLTPLEGGAQVCFIHSHEILRDVLQQVLRREYAREEIQHLHTRLAKLHQSKGEWEQTIVHYCQGQQFAQASQLISEQASTLINASDLAKLNAWLNHIPPDWLEQDPTLLLYQGIVLGHDQNPLAEEHLLRARQLFREQRNTAGAIWATMELGWIYWLLARYQQSVEILEKVSNYPNLPIDLCAPLLQHLGLAFHGVDRFEESLACLEQAAALFRQMDSGDSSIALARTLRHLGLIYHGFGRPQDSLRVTKEAQQLVKSLDPGSWPLAWIDHVLAVNHHRMGHIPEAHTCLDEADQLLLKYRQLGSESRLLDYVLITRGHLYRDTYDYKRAEEYYYRAGRGHPNGVMLALRLVQPGRAREALELASEKWRGKQYHESVVDRALYQALLGLAYLNVEDYAQARIHLEKADRVLEQRGFFYNLITGRMYLAKLYFALNELRQAKAYLHYTLSEMNRTGYHNLDVWQPWTIAEMCAQAIQYNIEPDFVEQLVLKRLTSDFAKPFQALINEPNTQIQERAMRILQPWGTSTQLQARQRLNRCQEETTRERLRKWLDQGWLTEVGLLRLKQLLSWREVEVFLFWIWPSFQGSVFQIAQELAIAPDTVNTYLKNIRLKLKDDQVVPFDLSGRGAYMEAYSWSVQNGFVDPHKMG